MLKWNPHCRGWLKFQYLYGQHTVPGSALWSHSNRWNILSDIEFKVQNFLSYGKTLGFKVQVYMNFWYYLSSSLSHQSVTNANSKVLSKVHTLPRELRLGVVRGVAQSNISFFLSFQKNLKTSPCIWCYFWIECGLKFGVCSNCMSTL